MKGSEFTMIQIEKSVCDAVNEIMRQEKRSIVNVKELYIGKKNIPLCRAMARNFCFHIMHNDYGFSYASIAQRAGMNEKSIMRCVRKYRMFAHYDIWYKKIGTILKRESL